jgi:NAD(P)-dependent dehydrogenase (short-subunit alcohol dehydrogenase family)
VVQETVGNFGGLDAIVNNGSVLHPIGSLANGDPGAWAHNLEVNLLGPYYLIHFALPHLRAQRGNVVNVSSGAAVRAIEGWSAYCVSKAGLNHLTHMLATEEPDIVAVNFRPGKVDTDMQATIRKDGLAGMPAEDHAQYVRFYQDGELLQPELPGRALAALALYAPAEWSGDFIQWDEDRMEALVNTHTPEMK